MVDHLINGGIALALLVVLLVVKRLVLWYSLPQDVKASVPEGFRSIRPWPSHDNTGISPSGVSWDSRE